jgi:protein-S-isoprenylcysteine O-methyltransferase Ste14
VKRASAIFGSAVFLVVAPGALALYIPWTVCHWRLAPPLLGLFSLRLVGALMITAGLPLLLDSFARFAIQGLGTPAPIAAPQRLVVSGLFRHVRNPMYVAVLLLILDWLFGWRFFLSLFFTKNLRCSESSERNTRNSALASPAGFLV